MKLHCCFLKLSYFQHDLRQGLLLGYNNSIKYETLPFPSMWKQKVQLGAWPKGSFWVVSVESSTRCPKFEVEWSFYGLICLSKDVIITNGQSLDVSGTAQIKQSIHNTLLKSSDCL